MKKKDLLKLIKDNSSNLNHEAKPINPLHVYSGFLNAEQVATLKKELDSFDVRSNKKVRK
mgnify:CR=1 FL=1|tara:strand:- start:380 stop:559 length:180 start_codon:yes stop_codon:yes gene_type:complete